MIYYPLIHLNMLNLTIYLFQEEDYEDDEEMPPPPKLDSHQKQILWGHLKAR